MFQNFVNLVFQHGLIPTVIKPTRVTRNTATAIDHIISNSVINAKFKTGIIKTNISDYRPIFFIFKCVLIVSRLGKDSYKNEITHVI